MKVQMNNWHVQAVKSARKDLKKALQSNLNRALMEIIDTLRTNPYAQTQSFEELIPPAASKYSRRLNSQHRVVYIIDIPSHTVTILSAWSHYE